MWSTSPTFKAFSSFELEITFQNLDMINLDMILTIQSSFKLCIVMHNEFIALGVYLVKIMHTLVCYFVKITHFKFCWKFQNNNSGVKDFCESKCIHQWTNYMGLKGAIEKWERLLKNPCLSQRSTTTAQRHAK